MMIKDLNPKNKEKETKNKNISNQEIIKKLQKENVELPDHIQGYFTQLNTDAKMNASSEIFNSKDEQLDFRTEINEEEIGKLISMRRNDQELSEYGIKPIYKDIITNFLRLRISKERKSREEFVNINRSDNSEEVMNKIGGLSNLKNLDNGQA